MKSQSPVCTPTQLFGKSYTKRLQQGLQRAFPYLPQEKLVLNQPGKQFSRRKQTIQFQPAHNVFSDDDNDDKQTTAQTECRAQSQLQKYSYRSNNQPWAFQLPRLHTLNIQSEQQIERIPKVHKPVVISVKPEPKAIQPQKRASIKVTEPIMQAPAAKVIIDHELKHLQLQPTDVLKLYEPYQDPPFFDIMIEKRHADQLQGVNLDKESRLQVIYRVLKDQLRRAKQELIEIKSFKESQRLVALENKKRMQRLKQEKVQKPTSDQVEPSFRKVARIVLSEKRHNKYCPCCRDFDSLPDSKQMTEFIEYIRKVHLQSLGPRKQKDTFLDYDSISEVTDLEDEGILSSSMAKLSVPERKRLKRFVLDLRKKIVVKKHSCSATSQQQTVTKGRRVVCEMQLKGLSEEKETREQEQSAHQFSYRSASMQADSKDWKQTQMQTELIDLKSDEPVQVYDLNQSCEVVRQSIGLKETVSKQCGTDQTVNTLATQDWYYSDLYIAILTSYHEARNIPMPPKVLKDFQSNRLNNRIDIANPSPSQTQMISAPEVPFLIKMLKLNQDKWCEPEILRDIQRQAAFTYKALTREMVEGKQQVYLQSNWDRESVITLLYRCEKLYQVRADVQKILAMVVRWQCNNDLTILPRLALAVSQFTTEYRAYDDCFIFKGQDIRLLIHEQSQQQSKLEQDRVVKQILKKEAQYERALGVPKGSPTQASRMARKPSQQPNEFLVKVEQDISTGGKMQAFSIASSTVKASRWAKLIEI